VSGVCAAKAVVMVTVPHILLLAGSFEARRMAEALSDQDVSYDAWLSEAPRGDARMPQTPLLRRFDAPEEMRDAIAQGGYRAVLDASHGFDRHVTQQGFAAAKMLGLPYLRLERPAWETEGHPKWHSVSDICTANTMIGQGARVFCATGWDSLPDYVGFQGEVLMLRQTRRHTRPAPYPFVELMFGDPPFTAADEQALFKDLKVDTLICRNLGGRASRPKLDAAEALNLEVILIERPCAPDGITTVADIHTALDWIKTL
jgi:precorrin-6A/cobalt-precorrin-6A reductase